MKEEWLKQMKERLDDYSEPAPASAWQRLEKELKQSSAPVAPRRIPLYRNWKVAAAAALLLGVSMVSLRFWQTSLPDEVGYSVTQAVQQSSDSSSSSSIPFVEPVLSASSVAVSSSVSADVAVSSSASSTDVTLSSLAAASSELVSSELVPSELVSSELAPSDLAPSDSVQETAPSHVQKSSSSHVQESAAVTARKERYRPSSRDKYHVAHVAQTNSGKRRWSVALAVGNPGGFVSSASGNVALLQNSPFLLSNGRVDLEATSNGILAIPNGQEVVFRDGIPYLSGRSRVIESIEHKQPVSVGMSVRKILGKGFSLETGLTYTCLASEVAFVGSSEKLRQKLHYVGIPLRANWSFWQKERFEMYVSAGGAMEKCVYGKIGSEEQTVKPLQFSVMGAVGAQLNLSQHWGIYIEPGVSYFFDDGSAVATIRKENPCNFTLQGGIRLTY